MKQLSDIIQFGVEDLHWPAQTHPSNTFGMNWIVDHKPGLITHPSVLDFTNTLAADWEQIPVARFRNLMESLKPEEWRLLQEQSKACGFGTDR